MFSAIGLSGAQPLGPAQFALDFFRAPPASTPEGDDDAAKDSQAEHHLLGPGAEQRTQRQEDTPEGRSCMPSCDAGGNEGGNEQKDAKSGRVSSSRPRKLGELAIALLRRVPAPMRITALAAE